MLTYSKEERTFKVTTGNIDIPQLANLAIWKNGPTYPLHAFLYKLLTAYSLGGGDDRYTARLINTAAEAWCNSVEFYLENPDKTNKAA